MISIFLRGALLGLGLIIPLGPQNTFIFQRASLQEKFIHLLPVLLVCILCDVSLILVAIIGADLIEPFVRWKLLLQLGGGIFLLYLSWNIWKNAKQEKGTIEQKALNLWQQVFYTLSVSLLNPHAILDTFFVIGTVSASYIGLEKHLFSLGCIIIDILWFLGLACLGFFLKKLKNGSKITFITNRISSIIMLVMALDIFRTIIIN
jgi:L-lysine exporter family protein LysE/ArgO